MFKDPINKHLEALSTSLFLLAGSALEQSIALMSVCQTLGEWAKFMSKYPATIDTDPLIVERLELMPSALHYCIEGLDNVVGIIF